MVTEVSFERRPAAKPDRQTGSRRPPLPKPRGKVTLDQIIDLIGSDNLSGRLKIGRRDNVVVTARPQSGKLAFVKNMVLRFQKRGIPSILITRNMNGDVSQLINSITDDSERIRKVYKSAAKSLNFPLVQDIRAASDAMLRQFFDDPCSLLLVGNSHPVTLAKLTKFFEKHPEYSGRAAIFLDESDLILIESNVALYNLTETVFDTLLKHAHAIVQTTATYLISVAGRGVTQLHALDPVLRPGRRYFGFEDVHHVPLGDDVRFGVGTRRKRYQIHANQHNLEVMLADMDRYRTAEGRTMGLINVDRSIDKHEEIAKWIQHHPAYKGRVCTVILNQGKLRVLHTKGRALAAEENYTVSQNVNLKKILTHLKHTGEDFIVIVSGEMAGRCLNFTDDQYELYLSHMLLSVPDSTPGDVLIQMQRLLGIYVTDRPPPRLFCTPELHADIGKEFRRLATLHRMLAKFGLSSLYHLINPESIRDPETRKAFIQWLDDNDSDMIEIDFAVTNRPATGPRKLQAVPLVEPTRYSRRPVFERDFDPDLDRGLVRISNYVDITGRDPRLDRIMLDMTGRGVHRPDHPDPSVRRDHQYVIAATRDLLRHLNPEPHLLPADPLIRLDAYLPGKAGRGGAGHRSAADISFSTTHPLVRKMYVFDRITRAVIPSLFFQDVYVAADYREGRVGLWLLRIPRPAKLGLICPAVRERAGGVLVDFQGNPLRQYTVGDPARGLAVTLMEHRQYASQRIRTTLGPGFACHKSNGRLTTVPADEILPGDDGLERDYAIRRAS
jgi:hypothetical protein